MKKTLTICLLCLALLLCGSAASAEEAQPAGLPETRHLTDAEGLVRATGISLPAPEGAGSVRFSYVELSDESPIAQLDYTVDGLEVRLRARSWAGFEPADISGLHREWTESTVTEVAGRAAKAYTDGEAGYIAWLDVVPGILYNLILKEDARLWRLTELANAAFSPLQGDVDGAPGYPEYRELVARVKQGLEDEWSQTIFSELDISEVFRRPEGLNLGWLQQDINGDGVDDLLFGGNREGDEASPIYDIFTVLDGKLVHPVSGWEYSRWYVLANGQLVNEATPDGWSRWCFVYGFFNGILVQTQRSVDSDEYLHFHFHSFDA